MSIIIADATISAAVTMPAAIRARIDAGDDGERDRFGNQRQRDDEAGQHIATDVGEPVLFDRLQHRTIQSKSTTMQTTGGRQRYKASFW